MGSQYKRMKINAFKKFCFVPFKLEMLLFDFRLCNTDQSGLLPRIKGLPLKPTNKTNVSTPHEFETLEPEIFLICSY